jgi:hypothetical protein
MSVGKRFRQMVATLEAEFRRDVHKARTALRQIVGNEISVPHGSGGHLVVKIGPDTEALLASGTSETLVVTGARYAQLLGHERSRWLAFAKNQAVRAKGLNCRGSFGTIS